jgi:alpha-galactosidase
MKKVFMLICLVAALYLRAAAQEIAIDKGWKFSTGDNEKWASPKFNDKNWKDISVYHSWEAQGYPGYDGFGWYRLHLIIPSSLKEKSFLKDSMRIDLGIIDDNDEVYLNGQLIGAYGGRVSDIKTGFYGPRHYVIAVNNPAILWNKENVLAVRIFDTGGDGGIYGSSHKIAMADLMDNVTIATDEDFNYGPANSLSKAIKVVATSKYPFKGKLTFTVTDPENNNVLYKKINEASFTSGKPFRYSFNVARLEKKSYLINYTFTDEKSGKTISKSEGTPYVLTPLPGAKPRINGPIVFGAHPGNPFLYLIPATGQTPLIYKVAGLPDGLKLDTASGIITGVVNQPGTYPVTLTVKNNLGNADKKFSIVIGDLIGLTPALGWNSWNAWGLTVNDEKVRTSARQMAEKLSTHGWNYINIDDGWEAKERLASGEITPNEKFPDMKGTADYVHSLGLKMGIYSSPGPLTCGGYLGSWQHEEQDAKTYGNWGIDYLKYDWCSYSEVTAKNPTLEDEKKPYEVMRAALNKVKRDVMFSFCQYGMGDVWKWGAAVGGNSWRSTGDINDTWASMAGIGFNQTADGPYTQPGHFNDPDMLVVGKVGWGDSHHNTKLTPDEQYTHISLWSLLSAPLLIGCDMGHLDAFTLGLLTNDEVLAIDQDPLGKSATQTIKTETYQVWVKDLLDGKAIGIFNTSDVYQNIVIDTNDELFKGYVKIADAWQQKLVEGNSTGKLTFRVPPHGVKLLKAF